MTEEIIPETPIRNDSRADWTNDDHDDDCGNENVKTAARDHNNEERTEYGMLSGFKSRRTLAMCWWSLPRFTGVYSLSGLITSTLSVYLNSQVTTLERHFGFNSSQAGMIMAANDVGYLLVVLFLSYLTSKVHIPKSLCYLTILFGISGMVCALPYFFFGAPSPPSTAVASNNVSTVTSSMSSRRTFSGQLCDGDNNTLSDCSHTALKTDYSKMAETDHPDNRARANAVTAMSIIIIGMVFQGVSKAPRFAFVTTYVDNNVEKTKTGFHMGIIMALSFLGPALAFALGGIFNRIYVTLEDTNLHYRHPKWVGAWWLGNIVFGGTACLVAIPLIFFPRQIKGGNRNKPTTVASADHGKRNVLKMLSLFVKGFIASMVRLLMNPVYVCMVMSACSVLFSVAGSQSFTPKYIEVQFSMSSWRTNLAMAGMLLLTACVGTFGGAYLTKRYKMGALASMRLAITMQAMSVIFTGLMAAFKCPQPFLYNSPGPRAMEVSWSPGCHDQCMCDNDDYFPVCGDDGRTYFSPCHAGCGSSLGSGYVNCTCIPTGKATAGMCDYSCSMFYPFMISLCFNSFFASLSIIPKLVVYLRCVEERDRPIAMGFSSFMSSLVGWMLGPICFGKLIDGICIQWDNACTGRGACRLYDNDIFRFKLIGYQAAFRILALVLIVVAWVKARKTGQYQKEGEEKTAVTEMALMTGECQNRVSSDTKERQSVPL